ncbi:MAG TPA: branched-chain amino acid ABC transporter permease [Methylomirabilota bacterium]|nr:branched-chain amino acid ABC transporter permease [Methylomirabilota bacterium]
MAFADLVQFCFAGITMGAIYGLVAVGFNIVFNATGAVNFAQGEFAMLGGMLGAALLAATRLPLTVVMVITVVAVTAIGVLLERLAIRPARGADVLNLIIITIGASILLKGAVMVTLGKNAAGLPAFSGERPIWLLGAAILPQALWIISVAIAIVLALQLFFGRTLLGKAMQAVAIDREAARLVGIDVGRMVMLSFALGAAVGAVAGIIITPMTLTIYDAGTMLGLKGFAAAVAGGLGNTFGGIAGGLLLGLLEALGGGIIASELKDVLAFVLLLLMLFFRPRGLLGAAESERV